MSGSAPTVPALKESFITAQTNLLSQPLAPSRNWQRANNASNQPIPTRLLDDALFSLSQTIQQHCRRVYPPQASYNVAEQISNSYLRDAEDRVTRLKESESSIGRELDLGKQICWSTARFPANPHELTRRARGKNQPLMIRLRPCRRHGPWKAT